MNIIAEFCQNHNGNIDVLLNMVKLAAQAGATFGKIQCIYAEDLIYRPQFEEGLLDNGIQRCIKRPYKEEYNRLKQLELSLYEQRRFIQACEDYGLIPMTTIFSQARIYETHQLGYKHIKVASYDSSSYSLLSTIFDLFPNIYISTGATYDDEILSLARFLDSRTSNSSIFHCVTKYPLDPEDANLNRIKYLRKLFPVVGYSDHSNIHIYGLEAVFAAIYLGVDVIESHFTILGISETKDGPVSISPTNLAHIKTFSLMDKVDQYNYLESHFPSWRRCLGSQTRQLSDIELLNRDYYRGRFGTRRNSCPLPLSQSNWIRNYEGLQ